MRNHRVEFSHFNYQICWTADFFEQVSIVEVNSNQHWIAEILLEVFHLYYTRLWMTKHLAISLNTVTQFCFFHISAAFQNSVEVKHNIGVVQLVFAIIIFLPKADLINQIASAGLFLRSD